MSGATHPVQDEPEARRVRGRTSRYSGAKWSLVTDEVELHDQVVVKRDVVIHPGAVGIVALDELEHVVLVRQYRHPVGASLWELPAGLLDEPNESPQRAAERELYEEAHLQADRWHLLVDLYSSPGMSSEVIRIFLAQGLHEVPLEQRHVQTDEEFEMPSVRLPLDAACDLALAGQLHNSAAVAGLLAAQRSRATAWVGLRPATTPLLRPTAPGPAASG